MFVGSIIALLALSPTAFGIAFPGPAPTATDGAFEANLYGRSPRPTGGPPSLPELFRRQQADDGVCGYLKGDSENSVSCSVGNCLYDNSLSWFGCCTGTVRSDCQLFTSCVGSASISSCLENSACANDDYALACTESTAGVCMTIWGNGDEGTVNHYVCGSTSTRVQILATPTGVSGSASVSVRSSSTAAFSSGGGLLRSSSTQQASNSSEDDDSSSTTQSSRAGASSATTNDTPRINTAATGATRNAATSTQSTAGAMRTAQAVLGAAGGLAGVIALVV
jgi:hypothetical protein